MPEGSQIIGLLIDKSLPEDTQVISKAQSILKKANADFTQILLAKDFRPYLNKNVQFIPTTVFVDSKGKIVGNSIVGSRKDAVYRAEIEERIERVARRAAIEDEIEKLK
jgi:hypothetical protein